MANLKDKLTQHMKHAMKQKDVLKLSVIRLLMAEIKNREIELRKELDDGEVLALIQHAVKQRKEAMEQYRRGGREDLAEKEEREMEILRAYLPEEISETELIRIIEDAIASTGASSPKEMGKVMREVMPRVKGRADGRLVKELVRKRLGG